MQNRELIEELKSGWILSEDRTKLVEVNYDTIPVGQIFAVLLRTGNYTIMQRAETFDDEVLRSTETFENTIKFLKQNS